MKNIHILPTDKARLYIHQGKLYDHKKTMHIADGTQIPQNICITSNEKPKAGDWSIYQNKIHKCIEDIIGDEFKKIILTTDQELIKNGVQAIDDEFLEWFVNNPSCEEVEVIEQELNTDYRSDWKQKFYYKVIIPKEELKQETLEEAVNKFKKTDVYINEIKQEIVKDLAYWKANAEEDYMKVPISVLRYISELENQMCGDEEVFNLCRAFATFVAHKDPSYKKQQEWFEQFKKK